MNRSLVLFLGIILLGGVLITLAYRSVDGTPPSSGAGAVKSLSDAQKALLETQSSLSKWLIGLAYASLAGVFGLRVKDLENERFAGRFPLVACALLVLSLYGGFLFQQASIFILTFGPAELLFGDGILLTLQVQFWLLVFGLIVLAVWLFRKPANGAKTVAVLAAALLAACPLAAAEAESDQVPACVASWQEDRREPLGPELAGEAAKLIRELAAREKVDIQGAELCSFSDSVLDELRFSVLQGGDEEKVPARMADFVATAREDLASPAYAAGDLVKKLVRLSQVWRSPSGLLQVLALDSRLEIFLSGQLVGVTNWTRRLKPGTYTLGFTEGGIRRREHDRQVTITDGGLVRVEIEGKPK